MKNYSFLELYPLYPNAAGMAWINLIKKEWTSNEIIELNSELEEEIFYRQIFNGQFDIELLDPGKSLIERRPIKTPL